MNFIGLLRTLEAITRPAGHDDDRPLAEEVSEPRCDCCEHPTAPELLKSGDDGESWCCPDCVAEALASEAEWRAINGDDDDAPNPAEQLAERSPHPVPREQRIGTYCEDYEVTGCSVDGCPIGCYHAHPTEPGLTPDELVGVRGLLQDYGALINLQTSASNHTGTGAEPAPSPTIVQSAPPPTVDGEGPASVRDIQPSPEAGRSTSGFTAGYLAAVDLFEVKAQAAQQDLDLADRLPKDHAVDPTALRKSTEWVQKTARYMRALAPTSPASPRSDDAAAEWIGEAVPVISEVLVDHRFYVQSAGASSHSYTYHCVDFDGCIHETFPRRGYPGSVDDWCAHIAPLIANALAPQDK